MNAFLEAYIEAALWSSTDESRPDGGDPLDANYGIGDLAPDTSARMAADCAVFEQDHAALLERAYARPGYGSARAGHDFWLTRNRHGAGFWDRDELKEAGLGDALTKAAHAAGECDLYVGDDGKVHA